MLFRSLDGADFVVVSVQPGSLELMGKEIAAASRRGRFFPVGDTTGAPGLARALRSAPLFAGFARAIADAVDAATRRSRELSGPAAGGTAKKS